MKETPEILQRAAQEVAASRTTSATAAGRTERPPTGGPPDTALIDAINQAFALFRLNYHNQFYAAYPDNEQLNLIKKLWLEALANCTAEQVLRGARHAIETSDYLPTINRMLESCREALQELGLPDARAAYLEACNARTPKSAQPWSHPAVYLAGRDAGWYFLSREPESRTWPVFRKHYEGYCRRAATGEALQVPAPEALPSGDNRPLPREEALAKIAEIRAGLKG